MTIPQAGRAISWGIVKVSEAFLHGQLEAVFRTEELRFDGIKVEPERVRVVFWISKGGTA